MVSLSFVSSQVWSRSKTAKETMHDFGSHDSLSRGILYLLQLHTVLGATCEPLSVLSNFSPWLKHKAMPFRATDQPHSPVLYPFLYLPTMVKR